MQVFSPGERWAELGRLVRILRADAIANESPAPYRCRVKSDVGIGGPGRICRDPFTFQRIPGDKQARLQDRTGTE